MPIIVQSSDYSWSEKKDRVVVRIPLKGSSPSGVDIFVTATTLKVNFNPYLLDIVLKAQVDSVKHKATVKEGVLVITLLKLVQEAWDVLVRDINDKKTLKRSRAARWSCKTRKRRLCRVNARIARLMTRSMPCANK